MEALENKKPQPLYCNNSLSSASTASSNNSYEAQKRLFLNYPSSARIYDKYFCGSLFIGNGFDKSIFESKRHRKVQCVSVYNHNNQDCISFLRGRYEITQGATIKRVCPRKGPEHPPKSPVPSITQLYIIS